MASQEGHSLSGEQGAGHRVRDVWATTGADDQVQRPEEEVQELGRAGVLDVLLQLGEQVDGQLGFLETVNELGLRGRSRPQREDALCRRLLPLLLPLLALVQLLERLCRLLQPRHEPLDVVQGAVEDLRLLLYLLSQQGPRRLLVQRLPTAEAWLAERALQPHAVFRGRRVPGVALEGDGGWALRGGQDRQPLPDLLLVALQGLGPHLLPQAAVRQRALDVLVHELRLHLVAVEEMDVGPALLRVLAHE